MGRLQGKVAVVMGATREGNMGQAIARRFIEEGAKVVVTGRNAEGLKAFAEKHGCAWQACDVRVKEQIQAVAEFAERQYGTVNIGVNAAGVGILKPFEDHTEADIDEMTSLIFKGGFFFMQVMLGAMKQGGAIANVSSAVADIMFEDHAAYMGAKAGLNHITRAVAYQYGQKGIRANIIAPGFTVTPLVKDMLVPGTEAAFAKEYPMGRVTTVDDVANVTLFACGDECFMTGETFHVTGGLRLRRNPTQAEIMSSVMAAMQQQKEQS